MRAAQANMRPLSARRFYKTAGVTEEGGRFVLSLDGRRARTPGRNPLAAASRALMLEVAAEWDRQRETIDPADMPLTRLMNSAIVGAALEAYDDPIPLAALSVMTTLTGSALLALAVAHGALAPEAAWRAAHIDEDFEIERWGADAEATARREARRREFEAAAFVAADARAA